MDETEKTRAVARAKRYLAALRLFYICPLALVAGVLAGFVLPMHGPWVLLFFATIAAALVLWVAAAVYVGDHVCPRCGLTATHRHHGKGRPLGRCMNCGTDVRAVARGEVPPRDADRYYPAP